MANSKLTTCKVCGAEVAKSAPTCPKCGAKLKKKHPILGVILGILGVLIILGAIGSGASKPKKVDPAETSTKTQTEAKATPTPEQTRFAVGEKVELNDVCATLVGVTESNGSQFNTPNEGNVFVLCEFEIENNSNADISVSSMISFETYCDDYATNISLAALIEKGNKNQLDGTVAGGKKMNGVVGYEVPADWKELEIHFKPNFWSGKDIEFYAVH